MLKTQILIKFIEKDIYILVLVYGYGCKCQYKNVRKVENNYAQKVA